MINQQQQRQQSEAPESSYLTVRNCVFVFVSGGRGGKREGGRGGTYIHKKGVRKKLGRHFNTRGWWGTRHGRREREDKRGEEEVKEGRWPLQGSHQLAGF